MPRRPPPQSFADRVEEEVAGAIFDAFGDCRRCGQPLGERHVCSAAPCSQAEHDELKKDHARFRAETVLDGFMGDDEETYELRHCKRCLGQLAIPVQPENRG